MSVLEYFSKTATRPL